METQQLSVLDLPAVNPLEILPRFGIRGKDVEAIAKFAETIGEIRLDQVEAQRAGNGKSAKQLQPNLPITIKTSAADAIAPSVNYAEQFQVGDRIKFRDGYRTNWDIEKRIGTIVKILTYGFEVVWDECEYGHIYTKDHIQGKQWWEKVIDAKFLENSNDVDSFPEISTKPKTQGYVEDYFVIGKNKKVYFYTRYVYQDISGKLRHHHIGKKQKESIAALWTGGASSKEICTALGKKYQSK